MNREKLHEISTHLTLAKDKITRLFGNEKMTENEIATLSTAIDNLNSIQSSIEDLNHFEYKER